MNSRSQYNVAASVSDTQINPRARNLAAVSIIEKAYLSYRDRQMFILLKHAVRAAEQSWTFDILRKISPREAELLNDPSVNAKVRFRFAGAEFPPIILFKIYLISNGTKYISGKKIIRPATNAAQDACRLMGHRKFYDQLIVDACQYEKDKITDEMDITTVKDYMQYLSNLDEMPSYLGGKGNYWRQLSLEALPRQNIMYDIMEYLRTKTQSARLQAEMPIMMSRPVTQEIQIEQFRALSRLPSPPSSAYPFTKAHVHHQVGATPSRRSTQSRKRVARMRKIYQNQPDTQDTQDLTIRATSPISRKVDTAENLSHPGTASREPTALSGPPQPSSGKYIRTDVEPEDDEARELYEWTRDLNFDDLNRGFPSSTRPESNSRSVSFSSHLTKRLYVT
nr:putative uncharacterized protein CXorf58 [Ciona intestinalis]XP_026690704.1 putative uncharacterized protein CXorf58 [Ciona intestinalis]|eukprot:XP_002119481.1 putative uncharacterized protein CXorf58 [Ciona intestinalis]